MTNELEPEIFRELLRHQVEVLATSARAFERLDPRKMTTAEVKATFLKVASIHQSISDTTQQQLVTVDAMNEINRDLRIQLAEIKQSIDQLQRQHEANRPSA